MLLAAKLFLFSEVVAAVLLQGHRSALLNKDAYSAQPFEQFTASSKLYPSLLRSLVRPRNFLRGGGVFGAEQKAENYFTQPLQKTSTVEPYGKIQHQRSGIQLFPDAETNQTPGSDSHPFPRSSPDMIA